MKFARASFLIFFFLYLLFPGDHQLREIGFGSEGFRILLPDVFLLIIVLSTARTYLKSFISIVKTISFLPFLLYFLMTLFSLIRGIPMFGGWAIGESRFFFTFLLMPACYSFYNKSLISTIQRCFYFAAFIHGLHVLFNYITNSPWDTVGDVERYGGGRESLIMGIAIVFYVINWLNSSKPKIKKAFYLINTIFLIICLFIGQTRSIFLLLPTASIFLLFLLGRIKLKKIIRVIVYTFLLIFLFDIIINYLLPVSLQKSITASFGVVGEVFNPETYKLIFDPSSALNSENWALFSSSGNTLFRVLAWSQTIMAINDYPGGWIWGMPMGTSFDWIGPGGVFNENMQPHNDFLVIVSKIGLVGLFAYISFIKTFYKNFLNERKLRSGIDFLNSNIFSLSVIIIMILLFAFLNAEIRTYGMHFWVWFFLGFGFKALGDLDKNAMCDN